MCDPQKLQDIATQTLIQAIDAVKSGGQWLAGQVPDVLHQLIIWTIAVGCISLVLFIITLVYNIKFWKWLINVVKEDDDYSPAVFLSAVANLIALAWYGCLLGNMSDAIKAFIAPKLFLLQYAADLIKHNS